MQSPPKLRLDRQYVTLPGGVRAKLIAVLQFSNPNRVYDAPQHCVCSGGTAIRGLAGIFAPLSPIASRTTSES